MITDGSMHLVWHTHHMSGWVALSCVRASQKGIITVEQRNSVLREVARLMGTLQRKQSLNSSGSFQSLEAFFSP